MNPFWPPPIYKAPRKKKTTRFPGAPGPRKKIRAPNIRFPLFFPDQPWACHGARGRPALLPPKHPVLYDIAPVAAAGLM